MFPAVAFGDRESVTQLGRGSTGRRFGRTGPGVNLRTKRRPLRNSLCLLLLCLKCERDIIRKSITTWKGCDKGAVGLLRLTDGFKKKKKPKIFRRLKLSLSHLIG